MEWMKGGRRLTMCPVLPPAAQRWCGTAHTHHTFSLACCAYSSVNRVMAPRPSPHPPPHPPLQAPPTSAGAEQALAVFWTWPCNVTHKGAFQWSFWASLPPGESLAALSKNKSSVTTAGHPMLHTALSTPVTGSQPTSIAHTPNLSWRSLLGVKQHKRKQISLF